jgi:hypothetical protein
MNQSMNLINLIFGLNQRLFNNALAGVTDEQASERISENNNPVNWIAAHTVWARYMMLMFLGKPVENPYDSYFQNFKAYDSGLKYPGIDEIKSEWKKVSDLLKDALANVSDELLAADSPLKSPIGDNSNAGTLAFLAEHESYDIGQLGFLKKFHTKEAMSYQEI